MFSQIIENSSWMTFNILLALIPTLLGWIFYKTKTNTIKFILFLTWILFIPNTLYLFTDILHLMDQVNTNFLTTTLLLIQYSILFIIGLFTYILSLYPIEKKLKLRSSAIIALNFLIGYGVVLGRVNRLNSWDIFTRTDLVINTMIQTITSLEIISLTLLFGLFGNFTYFLFKKKTIKYFSNIIKI